jgi:hypothetical protein
MERKRTVIYMLRSAVLMPRSMKLGCLAVKIFSDILEERVASIFRVNLTWRKHVSRDLPDYTVIFKL